MTDIIDSLQHIFETEGANAYLGEPISIADHMIQAAMCAEAEGAERSLVAAALLHDIGYFTDVRSSAEQRDKRHDEAGARYLADHFDEAVTEPIRLHVAAKRYLCAVEPGYEDKLSSASLRTLKLQGGPMNDAQVEAFERNPHHTAAVQIRRYDDSGKSSQRETRTFSDYRNLLSSCLTKG